ncbi:MAG: Hsp20/alpha crystallin family protein [Candidatus Eremiobacteraeota bacterium]|jgi:HSP20 family protein|nr:Hsp20/alpha crystallin family protein [Candidatus Eremiobacteraeota bacterium]MCL5054526.1 Hsp20/alpha crystallin family protein [Bacillota bacterium]
MPEEPEKTQEESSKKVPIRDLVNIRQAMNDLFSDLFSGRPLRALFPQEQWAPPVDIYENKDAIYILMDIPGMTAKDIDITATQDTIVIKGERKPVKDIGSENYILKEHSYGEFSRTIPLPYAIKPREIKAMYKDGTLELKLPKAKSGKGKTIRIDIE